MQSYFSKNTEIVIGKIEKATIRRCVRESTGGVSDTNKKPEYQSYKGPEYLVNLEYFFGPGDARIIQLET